VADAGGEAFGKGTAAEAGLVGQCCHGPGFFGSRVHGAECGGEVGIKQGAEPVIARTLGRGRGVDAYGLDEEDLGQVVHDAAATRQ